MPRSARRRLALAAVLLGAAVVFLLGITWGLPSRAIDPYLFGDEPVWSGEKIASLAPAENENLGADVDANPLGRRDWPVVLNETDQQKAEIIRRYRLFSYQPDEMITFRSLSRIREHRGDPRLYQYGGLWIYPVGAMLAAADVVGYVDLRGGTEGQGGQAYYLDHPEAFGRFYVVGRLYSALWGLVAVAAVFWLVRRVTGGGLAMPAAGALCFSFMPVVITLAHEAKPHLPGLTLTLLAAIAATKYVETGSRRFALLAGALCGAAFGMVLSALFAFALVGAMVIVRRDPPRQRLTALAIAVAAGLLVYAITNPFVPINALRRPEMLRSNLGNSTAMYSPSLGGVANGFGLISVGASPIVLVAGGAGLAIALVARRKDDTALWLLAAPALLGAIQFALLAKGKPPEYARFGLLSDVFLLVAACAGLSRIRRELAARIAAGGLVLATFMFGLPYMIAFHHDAAVAPDPTSRLVVARLVNESGKFGVKSVRLTAEPAPYIAPPINLFQYQLLYAPPGVAVDADVTLRLDQAHMLAPASWADVRYDVTIADAPVKSR